MRLQPLSISLLTAAVLLLGCGDSATEIAGTLPVVTGIRVDSLASRGDTIAVVWDAVSASQIEGYYLWARINIGDPWVLEDVVETNGADHIADRSLYYTVSAFQGENTSYTTGIPDHTRADPVQEKEQEYSGVPVGFRVDVEGDSLVTGDPMSPDFSQQFTIATDTSGKELYIYPGTANPMIWPSGARTAIAAAAGFVAPAPGDTTLWLDRIPVGMTFFLALENGYYCRLNSQDSSMVKLTLDGQLQPIMGVRVFNQTW